MDDRQLADAWTRDEYDTTDGYAVGMTYADVGVAVAVWVNCQGRIETTVQTAAAAFNMSEDGIRKAIQAAGNPYFYVDGDMFVIDGA